LKLIETSKHFVYIENQFFITSTELGDGRRVENSIGDALVERIIRAHTEEEDWRAPIVQYLRNETLPPEKDEANRLKKAAVHYVLVGDKVYKRGFSTPLLLCVSEMEAQRILKEIHDGSCGNHTAIG
jgi:phosphatidylserine/phosphatidylglycerophosphate/cardiolipin synthase-like enzyme